MKVRRKVATQRAINTGRLIRGFRAHISWQESSPNREGQIGPQGGQICQGTDVLSSL
jgi:hypothetical protein